MTMVVSVKPKAGRLATGSYQPISPIHSSNPEDGVFLSQPPTGVNLPLTGGLPMPDDRTQTLYQHPNARLFNTATQVVFRPTTTQAASQNTALVTTFQSSDRTSQVRSIAPYEKGKFFKHTITPLIKTQFGADGAKDSNTAFHPHQKKTIPRSRPSNPVSGERTATNSFFTRGNIWTDPNNSFMAGKLNATGQGHGSGRWNTIKKGVV
jgi:hypothetical protein